VDVLAIFGYVVVTFSVPYDVQDWRHRCGRSCLVELLSLLSIKEWLLYETI
jgi:hypothetical protein